MWQQTAGYRTDPEGFPTTYLLSTGSSIYAVEFIKSNDLVSGHMFAKYRLIS